MKIVRFNQCAECNDFGCDKTGWFVVDLKPPEAFGPFGTEREAEHALQSLNDLEASGLYKKTGDCN